MPSRSWRIFIKNTSGDTKLHLRSVHICRGGWTSSDWTPAVDILPGEEKGFQAEDPGLFQGTEGWIKYDALLMGSFTNVGMIYIYWNNPYYGRTYVGFDKDFHDVKVDCDSDDSGGGGGGSTFGGGSTSGDMPRQGKPSFDIVQTGLSYTAQGGDYTNIVADDVEYTSGAPLSQFGPVNWWTLLGLSGILQDPVAHCSFVVKASPNFGDLGTESLVLYTDATAASWAGSWSSDTVTLNISRGLWDMVRIEVIDNTSTPELRFNESAFLDDRSRQVVSAVGGVSQVLKQSASHPGSVAIKSKLSDLLRSAPPSNNSGVMVYKTLNALMSTANDLSLKVDAKEVLNLAKEIARAYVNSKCKLWLSNGVGLELYSIVKGGTKVGERIHYQRVANDGNVVADSMLTFRPQIN
jgi:hypothetical protein